VEGYGKLERRQILASATADNLLVCLLVLLHFHVSIISLQTVNISAK